MKNVEVAFTVDIELLAQRVLASCWSFLPEDVQEVEDFIMWVYDNKETDVFMCVHLVFVPVIESLWSEYSRH